MTYEIRPARAEEMDQLGLMGAYSYAGAFGDGVDNVVRNSQRPEWTLCAFDGDVMATSFAAFPFTIRANGGTLSYAGITAVGTRPEHRRRGLLRRIMTQAFADQRERGQVVAGLWASQAAIYQRYGFTAMGALRRYAVDSVDVRFVDNEDEHLRMQRYEGAAALQQMKAIYRDFIAQRFGYLHRSGAIWHDTILGEDETSGPLWTAVAHGADDAPRGYVVYSLRGNKVDNAARGQEIVVRDLAWLDTDAYRSIWRYLGMHDLVGRIVWATAPIDDPLSELIQEPRMLHTQDTEGTWLRLVDATEALKARGYDHDGAVSIELASDDLTPWNDGCHELRVTDGVAEVTRTRGQGALKMSVRALSAAFSGYRRVRDLAHWGLVQGEAEAIATLDLMLSTRHAPHLPDHY